MYAGIILKLKGMQYKNRSTINIREIGENDEALICQTDRRPCCQSLPNRTGEWYYPNGSNLTNKLSGRDLYRNRGDEGEVRLNRRNNALFPTGIYHCEVPDARNINRKVLVTLYNGMMKRCMNEIHLSTINVALVNQHYSTPNSSLALVLIANTNQLC